MAFCDVLSAFAPTAAAARSATCTAGLFVDGSEFSVPLRIRSVRSRVHCDSSFADTTETFAFISDQDVSAVFKFPLPPGAAVYKLIATIGDRTITTEVKPRQQAQQEFQQAVWQGHTAVITKQESSTQIFTLELGNLESMTEAVVEVSYLRVLDSVGGALEYVHTATWTPPYLGSAGDQQRGGAVAAQENPRFASKVAYSLAYDILLLSSRGIRSVDSAEGQMRLKDEVVEGVAAKHVTLSDSVADPSKDFTLMVQLNPIDSGMRTATTADGYGLVTLQQCERAAITPDAKPITKTVALATFVPSAAEYASSQEAITNNQEIVMIIDCSGSMEGEPIRQAREAAIYFIKDLPVGRKLLFNIVVFGWNHIIWSPSGCQELTAESMQYAVDWVNARVHANMGGTEMLNTFRDVYSMPVRLGYSRQIILLTDGGISCLEEESMYQLVEQNIRPCMPFMLQASIQSLKDKVLHQSSSTAGSKSDIAGPAIPVVLCLGIGHGVHRGLLDGCASRTGGVAQYVVDGESITRKVAFLKKVALAGPAAIQDARVVCGGAVARIAPHVLPKRLFPGEPVHVLLELQKYDDLNEVNIQLHGKKGDGSSFNLSLPLKDIKPVKGDAYAVLHGMCIVSGLSEGRSALHCNPDGSMLQTQPTEDQVKAAVTEIAVQEHLVTRYTAAVGVMIQKNPLDPGQVKKVEVPLATPHGADLFKYNMAPTSGSFFRTPLSTGSSLFYSGAPQPHQSFVPGFGNGFRSTFGAVPNSAPGFSNSSCSAFGAAPGTVLFGASPSLASPNTVLFGASPSGASPNTVLFGASPSLASPNTALFGASPFGASQSPVGGALFGGSAMQNGQSSIFGDSFGAAASSSPFAAPASSTPQYTPFSKSVVAHPKGVPQSAPAFSSSCALGPAVSFGAAAAVSQPAGTTLLGGLPSQPNHSSNTGAGGLFGSAWNAQGFATTPQPIQGGVPFGFSKPAPVLGGMPAKSPFDCATANQSMWENRRTTMVNGIEEMDQASRSMSWQPDNAVVAKFSTSDVLNLLNLKRGVDGYWAASSTDDEVLSAVTSQVVGVPAAARDAARSGKPAFLSADQWLTVLALAFLRKHCAADRSIWEGMEFKAMSWLQAAWPQGEKSLGVTILTAQKFV